MLDLNIAEISAISGVMSNGVVRGNINRPQIVATYSDIITAANVYAIRKDSNGANNIFTDVSDDAVSNVDNRFLPFGTDADFSANDEIWLANGDKKLMKYMSPLLHQVFTLVME